MENYKLKTYKNFLKLYTKIEKLITKFGDVEIKKQKFHQHKRHISIKNIDVNKIVVSSKASFGENGFKYSIG